VASFHKKNVQGGHEFQNVSKINTIIGLFQSNPFFEGGLAMSKKLIFLISLTLVLGAALPSIAANDPNLVGWWKFDGNALDSSGYGRDGTLVGDAQLVDNGLFDGALSLDGNGDYVTITGYKGIVADRTDPNNPTQRPFSVACWVNTTAAGGSLVCWGSSDGTGVGGQYQNFRIDGGRLRAEHGNGRFRGTALVNDGEWHHVAMTVAEGANLQPPGTQLYVDGQEDVQGADTSNAQNIWNITADADVGIGVRSSSGDRFFNGMFDDVRIYDRVLDANEVVLLAKHPRSYAPDPANGALVEDTSVLLQWTPGGYAAEHDVYFGTNPNPGPDQLIGRQSTTTYLASGLVQDQTYYWRIDDIEADGTVHTGDVWSFWVPPQRAYNPQPEDSLINTLTNVTLSWTGGWSPIMHAVYFGTDHDQVANATGAAPQMDIGYDPGPLQKDTTYYWRVDEFYGSNWVTGPVWSFKTLPAVPLAQDPNLVAWYTFDEGAGKTAVDWSGHDDNGQLVGDVQWAEGVLGGAVQFDGSGGDYIEAPEALNVTGTHSRTVTAWIKTADYGEIVSWGQDAAGQKWIFRVQESNGTLGAIRVEVNGGYQVGSIDVRDNEWHNVAAVLADDGSPDVNEIALYVDGFKENISAQLAAAINTASGVVRIGQSPWGSRPFRGLIDDVRIYDKAFTEQQMRQTFGNPALAYDPQPAYGATVDVRSILSWTAGDGAAQHDVYLGTDPNAVAAADASDATGIYRGRQADATYTPADGLAWTTTYYWRVDEVAADGTISKGHVWTFATSDSIVLYDVETPLQYDNTVAPYVSETSLDVTPPQNWSVAGNKGIGRIAISYTGQAAPGSVTVDDANGTIAVVGRGSDIWNTADQFEYAYTMLTGDGSMIVKVDSLAFTDPWTKAGLMIRESLDPGSAFAAVYATGANGVRFQARTAADQAAVSDSAVVTDEQKALNAPVWLKIERTFPTISAYYSTDGVTWTPMSWNPQVIPMSPAPIYIGLAVTSHSGASTYAEAVFSNLSSDGGVAAGPLTPAEIGLPSNSAEPMYLVLQDASGATSVVYNPDPAATQQASLTDWIVDLDQFNIDRTAVAKVTLGVGNLDNPTPGGTGLITISNVRLLPRLPKIIFVSFHGADDAPAAAAAAVGFTEASDKGYTDLLKANGYNVTRYLTTNDPDPNVLNAADLVIISRAVSSSGYQNDGATAWNTRITAPMMILGGYVLRSSRMGYTTGSDMVDTTGDIKLTVSDPTNPIFAGIALTDGTMDNPYASGTVVLPTDGVTVSRGISINNDPPDDEGMVLATVAQASADTGPVGGMVIAEWPAGATLQHSGGAGTDVLAGPRLVFLTGSREPSGVTGGEAAGLFDLYNDGTKMFLNAVKYMVSVGAPQ
jgi:Concanavalin A-like lectin/glucanases superfamily